MKWFKHESDANMNLKLQAVIAKFGMQGYGLYWLCVELVALQGTNYRIKAEKNWKIVVKKASELPEQIIEDITAYFGETNLIDKKALQKGDLFIPKLQERSDEYTKKVQRVSGHKSDIIPLEEKRTEEEKKRIEQIPLVIKSFEKINPACKKFYGNQTQREACYQLLEMHGIDRILGIVEKTLPKTNGAEFFPTIVTPQHLFEKWSSLEAAVKRLMSKTQREQASVGKVFW